MLCSWSQIKGKGVTSIWRFVGSTSSSCRLWEMNSMMQRGRCFELRTTARSSTSSKLLRSRAKSDPEMMWHCIRLEAYIYVSYWIKAWSSSFVKRFITGKPTYNLLQTKRIPSYKHKEEKSSGCRSRLRKWLLAHFKEIKRPKLQIPSKSANLRHKLPQIWFPNPSPGLFMQNENLIRIDALESTSKFNEEPKSEA